MSKQTVQQVDFEIEVHRKEWNSGYSFYRIWQQRYFQDCIRPTKKPGQSQKNAASD